MKKEHILVIRFSALGDVAMTVPVIWSLAHQYPDVRITVLSRNSSRPLFEDLAPNVGFMGADLKREYRGIKGLNALYRRLTAKQFTHVADLHNVLRSEFLRMRFNLGSFRVEHIDKHRKGRRRLISGNSRLLEQQPTSFDNYTDVLEKLGFPIKIDFRSIFGEGKGDLSQLPTLNAQRLRVGEQSSGMLSTLNIGIAPFAAHQGKVYPPHLMQQVIELLTQQYPEARIFLFGRGQQEEEWFSKWCQQYQQCTYVGHIVENMRQELILMSHLDIMLSMDSANMHLASLVATPVVSVWGATHPYAGFMGWNQKVENAIQLDLDCRPCSIFGQKPCRRGDYACLNNIKPTTIVEKINSILLTKQNT